MKKKFLALLLALTLAAGLLVFPASAGSDVSTFPDIADPDVGEAVEVLRIMGILGGDSSGRYNPQGSLTRAEFAKIAVLLLGKGDEVSAYENRTIFVDVPSTHWARGYVNLAVNTLIPDGGEGGGTRLLQGGANGRFSPDAPITYAEAVTVLLRMLGYGGQINSWPTDALTLAASLKLDADIGSHSDTGSITRAQAALLFRSLLLTSSAGGSAIYAASLGSLREGVILTSASARTADGGRGVTLSDSTEAMRAAASLPADFMVGKRGTAVLDRKGRFLTFIPDASVVSRPVTVQSASPTSITGTDGVKLSVSPSAKVLRDGKEHDFGEIYQGLNRPGLTLTVYYTAAGSIDYIFVRGAEAISGEVMVAEKDGAGAFDTITNASRSCRVVKNGAQAALTDLRKLDVGVFDAASNTLYVTDFRLSAYFETASPNPYAPTSITLYGRKLDVLSMAVPSFEDVKVGETVVFLFSPDGKIAGVRRQREASSTAVGVVAASTDEGKVTVELLNAPLQPDENGAVTITATVTGNISRYLGQVVGLSGGYNWTEGKNVPVLYLSVLASSDSAGNFDVRGRTVGTLPLADNAVVFEKVGRSALTAISLADIPFSTVPASKVTFLHKDAAGRVDILVLNDVTGDRYTYGLIEVTQETTDYSSVFGEIKNNVTTVTYGDDQEKDCLQVAGAFGRDDKFGGAAASLNMLGTFHTSAGFATLTAVEDVAQASFDLSSDTFTSESFALPIADAVRCYNEATGKWFDSLEQALLYSNSFTVYYDRTPSTGAKVRIVVVH